MAAKAKATNEQNPLGFNWPTDTEGKPMVMISMSAQELVPTGNYANVTIGPATVVKFVEDGAEDEIREDILTLSTKIIEPALGERREAVLAALQQG